MNQGAVRKKRRKTRMTAFYAATATMNQGAVRKKRRSDVLLVFVVPRIGPRVQNSAKIASQNLHPDPKRSEAAKMTRKKRNEKNSRRRAFTNRDELSA